MSLELLKPYVEQSDKDSESSYGYRAKSAYDMLSHIDKMIASYEQDERLEQGEILLDVFGLLQGFFVGVDSLYDLAIGLTHYKYHININQNKVLHQLKFIRNDIVGHPTNRTYHKGSIGFSLLIPHSLTKDKMSYQTYVYHKNKLEVKTEDVVFKDMINAFVNEKEQLIKDIYQFVSKQPKNGKLLNDLLDLYDTMNLGLAEKIKSDFMKKFGLDEHSKHRFLWRIDLVFTLIKWFDQDDELDAFIVYMTRMQITKLYDMLCDIEDVRGKDLYTSLPDVLKGFYQFIRKNEDQAYPLLEHMHDLDHPHHHEALEHLMLLHPKKDAYKLLNFLKVQTSEEKVYLIGSMLKKYRLKNH